MHLGPLAVIIEGTLRTVAKPSVAVATLLGDFIHVIVDCFIPLAEEGAVAADFSVTRPQWR